jgi:hypothetical protein
MSIYSAQAGLENDNEFRQRVRSCVVQETLGEATSKPVTTIVAEIMPEVAAAPGLAEKYLYGDQAGGLPPGQSAISDGEVLATVQPMIEEYRPEPAEPEGA